MRPRSITPRIEVVTAGSYLPHHCLREDRLYVTNTRILGVRVRFGPFTLDTAQRQLLRANKPLQLSPKAFTLLDALARNGPRALSKEEIQQILWPDAFVEEGSLHNLVSEIRRVLGDRNRKLLRTVPRFGYALELPPRRDESDLSRFCLVLGETILPLRIGENVLGRGVDADVPVELSGVSRYHARIIVTMDSARIEDLDSKNGTFVGTKRVVDSAPLQDGDKILLGRVLLTFRTDRRRASTITENPGPDN
jgi:DNA-binding winged helix-turn-helix (wHTH) protein